MIFYNMETTHTGGNIYVNGNIFARGFPLQIDFGVPGVYFEVVNVLLTIE